MDYEGTLVLIPLYLKVIEMILMESKMNSDDEISAILSRILQKKYPIHTVQSSCLALLQTILSFSHGLPQMKVVYFDKGQQAVELRHFFMRVVSTANSFYDTYPRQVFIKSEEISDSYAELNYNLKTLQFMIICYYASQDTNSTKNEAIQVFTWKNIFVDLMSV